LFLLHAQLARAEGPDGQAASVSWWTAEEMPLAAQGASVEKADRSVIYRETNVGELGGDVIGASW
jgi:hypothetical protein